MDAPAYPRLRRGTVDIISFATLGGVFASAMTGNFALLAYYVAQSDSQSAMGSVVALIGFAIGCAVGVPFCAAAERRKQALRILLVSETGLLLFFSHCTRCGPLIRRHAPSDHLQILLLAVAMGLQGRYRSDDQSDHHRVYDDADQVWSETICGFNCQRRCIGPERCENPKRDSGFLPVRRAPCPGALIVHKVEEVVLLPFAGVAPPPPPPPPAFAMHRRSGLKGRVMGPLAALYCPVARLPLH